MKIVITVKDTDNVIGLKEDIAMRLEGVADIVRIATVDVAPKSEVDQLERNLAQCENGYRQEMHLLQCKLANAKTEVAREIFDDIEKEIELAIDSNCKVRRDAQDDNDSLAMYVEGKIDCLR